MAKKSFKLVKASAALAVTAAALTPVMAAEASTSVVELKAEVVLGGKFKEALALNAPKGVTITWGKHLVTAINKWQTVTGKGSDGKTYIKKLYARNYPLYVLDQDLGEVEAGSELVKPSIRVMYRDGKVYTQAPTNFTMSSNYNTKDLGKQEVLVSYNHNGNRITKLLTYTVVAGEVEFANVSSSVDQAAEVLSVNADVKNLKEGEKVELVVYAGRDVNAPLAPVQAEVKDGKVSVKSVKLPAGNHSFILRSGDVKTEAVNFVVEAPMVKEVKAINATQVEVAFNKAVDPATLFANGVSGAFNAGATVTLTTIDAVASGALTGTLSADGQTLTITSTNALSKRYDVVVDGIKTKDAKAIAKYNKVVEFAADTTAPMVVSTVKKTASTFTVKFSEPMNNLGSVSYKLADGTSVSATATGVVNDFVAGAQEVTFTVGSEVAAGKQVIATFVGAQDQALNIISPNPATVSFVKGDKDGVAPTVTSLVAVNNKTIEVKFSEELQANPSITGFAGTLSFKQDASDKTKYTITSNTANTGLKTVSVDAGYTDLSGEAGAVYSKVLNFDVDTVAPKVASTKVVKVDGVEYLEVSFDEIVETDAALTTLEVTGTKVSNFVTSNITPVSVPVAKFVQVSTDKKSYRVTLADLLGANSTKDASYSLDIAGNSTVTPVALVSDLSGNAGPSTFKANVVRSEDATAPSNTKASLDTSFSTNGIQVNADKTITVRFNQELDGASATNIANYKFDGAVVEKAVLSPVVAGKQDVTLTLKAGSNVFTGLRNVTISGVKAKDGLVMDTVTTQETLVENVAPTVTSAKLTAPGVITLNFSENVYNLADGAGDDFDLYIGGVKVTATTLDTEDVLKVAAKNTLTLTVGGTALTAEDLTKGLSIKAVEGIDIMDANDNVLSVGTVSVAQ
jgi:hypothetical protein